MAAAILTFVIGIFVYVPSCHSVERHAVIGKGGLGIIGGHPIPIQRAPYMALLRGYENGSWSYWCGASIIDDQFVLTAAHCILPNNEYKVLVGTANANEKGELIDVKHIFIHPKFNLKTFNYDFCVIELSKAVTFSTKVAKIKLQETDEDFPEGTKLNATGCGVTEEESQPRMLQQVELPLVDRRKCKAQYEEFGGTITLQKICAGNRGHGTCVGDSGGPLTLGDVQVGVTSSGSETCGIVPAAFSRIPSARAWILDKIKKNSSL